MAEWKLFDGDVPYVSTADYHAERPRAPHLEQPQHRPRLDLAAEFVRDVAGSIGPDVTVSDLGCGDGGLLSLIKPIKAWGYDFCPANAAGWGERDVAAQQLDVFGVDRDQVRFGDITCVTEVLEHVADPHGAVRWIAGSSRAIVASSPWNEGPGSHDDCHAWAFDLDGYRALIEQGGFTVLRHEMVHRYQVILGWRAGV